MYFMTKLTAKAKQITFYGFSILGSIDIIKTKVNTLFYDYHWASKNCNSKHCPHAWLCEAAKKSEY